MCGFLVLDGLMAVDEGEGCFSRFPPFIIFFHVFFFILQTQPAYAL